MAIVFNVAQDNSMEFTSGEARQTQATLQQSPVSMHGCSITSLHLMEHPDEQVDSAAIRPDRLVGFTEQILLL
ncbi:hypothetical protein KBY61_08150 [Cyanobium sp. To12R1]|nr:hypothetical protein [Cyanobium sp. To12R1]